MQRLPPVLSLQELEEYRDKLKQQQAAVSEVVSSEPSGNLLYCLKV